MHPGVSVISYVSVSLIICTGRPFLHDRHFRAASSFQIGVSRGRRYLPVSTLSGLFLKTAVA
jgi:hypothetical protein